MIDSIRDWLQVMRLAKHIHQNLPPKDGKYHAVSINIQLSSPLKPKRRKE